MLPARGDEEGTKPGDAARSPLKVDRRLLEILVCPMTRGPLEWNSSTNTLVSRQAALEYPIRDGIPIMLIEEAKPLDR